MNEYIKNFIISVYVNNNSYIVPKKKIKEIENIFNNIKKQGLYGLKYFFKFKKQTFKITSYNIYEDFNINKKYINKYVYNEIIYENIKDIESNERIKIIFNNIDKSDKIENLLKRHQIKSFYKTSDSTLFNINTEIDDNLKQMFKGFLYYVVDVVEFDNDNRVAKVYNCNDYLYIFLNPNDDIYNYMDKNRVIYIAYNNNFIAFDVNENPSKEQINNYDRYIDYNAINNTYISDKDCLSYKTKLLLKEQKEEKRRAILKKKQEIFDKNIKNLDKKPLIKDDIKFTNHTMEYEGIKVDTFKFYDFKKCLSVNYNTTINFNELLNKIITDMVYYNLFNGDNWLIPSNVRYDNDISFTNILDTPNKIKIDNKIFTFGQYHINNIRINKLEIDKVLHHCLCYKTLDDFNKFVKLVSKCNLNITNLINKGLTVKVRMNNDIIPHTFKLMRIKNKNYLINGKKQYKINDTNKFLNTIVSRYNSGVSLNNVILAIISYTECELSDIKSLMKDSLQRYEIALKKSEKLLNETIKALDVKKKTINNNLGYIVNGNSGTKYFVNEKSNQVSKILNNKLKNVCIVNKGSGDQVGKDALVSRLYALKNDSFVTKDIHTL